MLMTAQDIVSFDGSAASWSRIRADCSRLCSGHHEVRARLPHTDDLAWGPPLSAPRRYPPVAGLRNRRQNTDKETQPHDLGCLRNMSSGAQSKVSDETTAASNSGPVRVCRGIPRSLAVLPCTSSRKTKSDRLCEKLLSLFRACSVRSSRKKKKT